jgi:hypothetical protein
LFSDSLMNRTACGYSAAYTATFAFIHASVDQTTDLRTGVRRFKIIIYIRSYQLEEFWLPP